MSKPDFELEDINYKKDVEFFYQIIKEFKTPEDVKNFMQDLFTSSELRMIKKRWRIASLLSNGLDIRSIASHTESGTETVIKVKRILEEGNGSLSLALKKLNKKLEDERKQRAKKIN